MLRLKRQEGQGLVEYALILVLVAIVVIAVLLTLGPMVGQVFSDVTNTLTNGGAGGGGRTYSISFSLSKSSGSLPGSCNATVSSISITVTDDNGDPVSGISVTPSVRSTGVNKSLSSQSTNGSGIASGWPSENLSVGADCGSTQVTVSAGGASVTK